MDDRPYAGRILWVDLTTGNYRRQELPVFWPLPPSNRNGHKELLCQEWRFLLATFRD